MPGASATTLTSNQPSTLELTWPLLSALGACEANGVLAVHRPGGSCISRNDVRKRA